MAAPLEGYHLAVVAELAGIADLLHLMADQGQLSGGAGGELPGLGPEVLAPLRGHARVHRCGEHRQQQQAEGCSLQAEAPAQAQGVSERGWG
ncbi:MAG: hypothetical protein ACK559_28205 [bacterium]